LIIPSRHIDIKRSRCLHLFHKNTLVRRLFAEIRTVIELYRPQSLIINISLYGKLTFRNVERLESGVDELLVIGAVEVGQLSGLY
jgi:hypothetical protein